MGLLSGLKKSKKNNTRIIGVSGTYGKTVLAHMIAHILRTNNLQAKLFSSIGIIDEDGSIDENIKINNLSKREVQRKINSLLKDNPQYLVIEMPKDKVREDYFKDFTLDAGVVTNIDFIYNNSWNIEKTEDFIFTYMGLIKENGLLVVNSDSEILSKTVTDVAKTLNQNVFCYWATGQNIKDLRISYSGVSYSTEDNYQVETMVLGNQNTMNSYLALKVTSRYLSIDQINSALKIFEPIKGRFHVNEFMNRKLFIDNSKSFKLIKRSVVNSVIFRKSHAKLILLMGKPHFNKESIPREIAEYVDILLLAPTDPNLGQTFEVNSEIFHEISTHKVKMLERFTSSDEVDMISIENIKSRVDNLKIHNETSVFAFDSHDYTARLDAIKFAFKLSNPDDIILITGKGNEDFLMFDDTEYEWSDYEALKMVDVNSVV